MKKKSVVINGSRYMCGNLNQLKSTIYTIARRLQYRKFALITDGTQVSSPEDIGKIPKVIEILPQDLYGLS